MRRIAIAGTLTLALALGACAAKQPPTPPPLNLVTEAEPKRKRRKLRQPLSRSLQRSRPRFSRLSRSTTRAAIGQSTSPRVHPLSL